MERTISLALSTTVSRDVELYRVGLGQTSLSLHSHPPCYLTSSPDDDCQKMLSQGTLLDRSVHLPRRTWYDPRAEFRDSPIHGKGMFASKPISCGEIVVRIGGQLMTGAEFQSYVATVSKYNAVQVGEDAHLVEIHAAHRGMNHSCDSNLWMSDRNTLVARREISRNEELTHDYALYTANPRWVLKPCRCGARVCRHEITGDDWRLLDVQEQYKNHFSPFLNDRIRRLNEAHPV